MAVRFEEILQEFSPERRARIRRCADQMDAQHRTLAGLRKTLGVSQRRLADALETSQSNVAQIESKADVMVSTVARVVDALGGELHLVVTLPGRDPVALVLGGAADEPSLDRAAAEAAPAQRTARPRRPAAPTRATSAKKAPSDKAAGKRGKARATGGD